MPLSAYDQYFGGKEGSTSKAKAAMAKEYGSKKGEQIFYATKNKKKSDMRGPTTKDAARALMAH